MTESDIKAWLYDTGLLKEYKYLLWKDELGDPSLITKWCEVFIYSDSEIRLYIWSSKMYSRLKNEGLILWEDPSDDLFYTINVKLSYLPEILARSGFKRRPVLHGRWIKTLEKRLGHQILPYNPKIDDKEKI